MPDPKSSSIVVENGRRIQRLNGAPDLDLGPAVGGEGGPAEPSVTSRVLQTLRNASPEITAGLSAVLAPETGFASLLIPPAVAGVTEMARQYGEKNSVDPMAVGVRTGVNVIPGVVGKVVGKATGGTAIHDLLEGMSQGDSWISSLAKGARGMMGETIPPKVAAAQAGGKANASVGVQVQLLKEKLADPRLNAQAKAAVQTAIDKLQGGRASNVAQSIRTLLGLGTSTTNEPGAP